MRQRGDRVGARVEEPTRALYQLTYHRTWGTLVRNGVPWFIHEDLRRRDSALSYRAMYAYTWDLAEAGVDQSIETLQGLGIDTITLATSYHAGKFLRPRGTNGKVYFPEDGTAYFISDPSKYGVIQPLANSGIGERDILRELTDRDGMQTNAWLVMMHNSRLGEKHPESSIQNAFGDVYINSLCPSAPDARAYAVALVRDVTENYPVDGLNLESIGFPPYVHGYHHEMSFVQPNPWLDAQLGLCFCRHCVEGAESVGIDASRLRARVAEEITAYLDSGVNLPEDMANAFWAADIRSGEELGGYLNYRATVVTSLIAEIRTAVPSNVTVSVIPSVARPTAGAWYEGSDLRALAETTGLLEACFYEPSVDRISADLFDIKRRLRGVGKLRGILRPAYPDLGNEQAVVDAVSVLAEGGVTEFGFYNYGHIRRQSLDWIKAAISAIGEASR